MVKRIHILGASGSGTTTWDEPWLSVSTMLTLIPTIISGCLLIHRFVNHVPSQNVNNFL